MVLVQSVNFLFLQIEEDIVLLIGIGSKCKIFLLQIEEDGGMDKLLDFHLYFTAALQRTDMRAVGLQLAMDLIHRKVNKSLNLNFQK